MESSFRIGEWLVEPLQNRLVRGDTRVKLDPKVMQVLLYLAERPNEVALKEKIIETVWDGTFVTDEVLTNAIFELRKALGDDAKDPRFIQTVPRKGYRLLRPVEAANGAPRPKIALAAVIVVVVVAAAAGFYFVRNEAPDVEIRTVPVTGFPGAEEWPALSPDGNRIAFVWDRGKSGPHKSLHVQMIGSGEPLRLTDSVLHEFSPVWSPDGKEVAFLRETELGESRESDVLVISALGGPVRRLATVGAVDIPGGGRSPGIAWSPDGRFLAVVDQESRDEPQAIFLLSLESGEKRRLSSPPLHVMGDTQPTFSPHGKTLAFARMPGFAQNQIYVQEIDGGEPRLLATDEGWITDLDWTADGLAIVFVSASEREAGTSLFKVSTSGGLPGRLSFGEMAHTLSISRTGDRLVHDRRSWFNTDIWRIDGPAAGERGEPTRLIASSRMDWGPEYSPDGTRIAFASEWSGRNNIWVCEDDGTGCIQLTHMERANPPRWSPDGKRLVHRGRENDTEIRLYVTEVEGGFTRALPGTDSRDGQPSWSHDGRWLYFTSERTGARQIWKMPAEGGNATQITRNGGVNPRESVDGRFLYYADRWGKCSIRRVSVNGGEERSVLAGQGTFTMGWALWGEQLVYVTSDQGDPRLHVDVRDIESEEVRRIFSSPEDLAIGMSVSPDGRWVLISKNEPASSDIMLVEGFR